MNFAKAPKRERQNITIDPELLEIVQGEALQAGVKISHVIEGRLRASYEAERGSALVPVVEQLQMDIEEILRLLRPVAAWMQQMGVSDGASVSPAAKTVHQTEQPSDGYYQQQLAAEAKTPTPPVVTAPMKKGRFW